MKQILKIFLKILFYIMGDILFFISCVIPKNKKIWIFGSGYGKYFSDNSKYLFLYTVKNYTNIRSIWLSTNRKLVKKLKSKGFEAYTTFSIKGIFFSMIASGLVVSYGTIDVNKFIVGNSKIVQLWHGVGIKKIMHDDFIYTKLGTKVLLKRVAKLLFPFIYRNIKPDIVISTSPLIQERFSKAFKIPKSKVPITGYPRNDIFFEINSSIFKDSLEREKGQKYKYLIIYLPTFRSRVSDELDYLLIKNGFEIEKIEKFLLKLEAALIIKLHPSKSINNQTLLRKINQSKNIKILNEDEIGGDIYPILKESSILITDYSSVFTDYLLLDRPIIFTPFDIEEYIKAEREFYDDYDFITPGPKAKDWDEVIKYIIESIEYPNKYSKKRKKVCNMFHAYKDNRNSERVFNAIYNLLITGT